MWRRLFSVWQRNKLERDLGDEMDFHLAMLVDEKIRQGLSEDEARLAARREFGGIDQAKEQYRDIRGIPALENVLSDITLGLRRFRQDAPATAVILISLALGIGAGTAVFSTANAVLLRPLQIPAADRAVVLLSTDPRAGTSFSVAEGVFLDWRNRSRSFETIAGSWNTSMVFKGDGQPESVSVVRSTASYFDMAGLHALEGRLFDRAAEKAGKDDVALLDAGFWRTRMGGRRDVLGNQVFLDDRPYTVIGIVEPAFGLGPIRGAKVWLPLVAREGARSGGPVTVLGRLRPDVPLAAAQSEMDAIQKQIAREQPSDAPFGVRIQALKDWIVSDVRSALLAITSAVALLLLICCVNITSLLLARASVRQREFAIRASLGGGRLRLVRQLFVEHLVLAGAGGAAGCLVAFALVRTVQHIRALYLPRSEELQPDLRMLGMAVVLTVGMGVLFGLLPAWQATKLDLLQGLQGASPEVTSRRSHQRLRRTLVVAQLGLSLWCSSLQRDYSSTAFYVYGL